MQVSVKQGITSVIKLFQGSKMFQIKQGLKMKKNSILGQNCKNCENGVSTEKI